MKLTNSKTIQKKIDKLWKAPDHQHIEVAPNNTAILHCGAMKFSSSEYCIASSDWIYCRHNDFYNSSKGDLTDSIALADTTEDKVLVFQTLSQAFYISPNNLPDPDEFFVAYIVTHRILFFCCYDIWMQAPFIVNYPVEDYQLFVGLTLNFLKAHNPQWHDKYFNVCFPKLNPIYRNTADSETPNKKDDSTDECTQEGDTES